MNNCACHQGPERELQVRNFIVERLNNLYSKAIVRLALWRQNARGRKELQRLNTEQLKDIGLSRADALTESYKPFWRD